VLAPRYTLRSLLGIAYKGLASSHTPSTYYLLQEMGTLAEKGAGEVGTPIHQIAATLAACAPRA